MEGRAATANILQQVPVVAEGVPALKVKSFLHCSLGRSKKCHQRLSGLTSRRMIRQGEAAAGTVIAQESRGHRDVRNLARVAATDGRQAGKPWTDAGGARGGPAEARARGPAAGADGAALQASRRDVESVAVEENGASADTPLLRPKTSTSPSNHFSWSSVILPFLFPALGGLLFGYDIGATSGALLSLKDPVLSGTDWYGFSTTATGLVVSGSLGGALVGSALAFLIADPLGRKKELLLSSLLYASGAAGMGLAPSLEVLLIGHFVYGLGIGAAMHGAPMYIAETSPPSIRGRLVSLKEAFIVGGILLGYLVASAFVTDVGGWRLMYGLAGPMALLMGLGMLSLPESPSWLLLRAVQGGEGQLELSNARERAGEAIRRLRGGVVSVAEVEEQMEETMGALGGSGGGGEGEGRLVDLVRGTNLKALLIGTGLVFFQQVTGQPSVLYYAATILKDAGFSAAAEASNVAVGLGAFKLVMTGVAVVTVDSWGRRPLLLAGVGGIVASLAILTATYGLGTSVPVLSVGALLLYVGSYQISFGPISWLMVSEVFPLRVRGKALSVATLVNFGTNTLVAFALPTVQASLGRSGTFFAFFIIGVGAFVFVLTSVPETKGLSLEDIEIKLSSKK